MTITFNPALRAQYANTLAFTKADSKYDNLLRTIIARSEEVRKFQEKNPTADSFFYRICRVGKNEYAFHIQAFGDKVKRKDGKFESGLTIYANGKYDWTTMPEGESSSHRMIASDILPNPLKQ
ncbi:MAG: hypothetical protein V4691_09675 [Pseudomonadota bacterium]